MRTREFEMRAVADRLGIVLDPNGSFTDWQDQIDDVVQRREPCRGCGVFGVRDHRFDCDDCRVKQDVERCLEAEERHRQWVARGEREDAARRAAARLSPGRRRLLDGVPAGSVEMVYREAFGEIG